MVVLIKKAMDCTVKPRVLICSLIRCLIISRLACVIFIYITTQSSNITFKPITINNLIVNVLGIDNCLRHSALSEIYNSQSKGLDKKNQITAVNNYIYITKYKHKAYRFLYKLFTEILIQHLNRPLKCIQIKTSKQKTYYFRKKGTFFFFLLKGCLYLYHRSNCTFTRSRIGFYLVDLIDAYSTFSESLLNA